MASVNGHGVMWLPARGNSQEQWGGKLSIEY